MKHVIFTEEADRDLEQASVWFDEHSRIGGTGFVAAIREVVERISGMAARGAALDLRSEVSSLDGATSPLSRDLRGHG